MKFKELTEDTMWMPGALYEKRQKPQLSILLPTFSRGRSGLFSRCVESIISQTLRDIELIIIDDASTDGTADQIEAYMAKDGRISCLRHVKNIGLPAVSEYEAYFRARADRIAFAFDDNFFYENAFEQLLEESVKNPGAMVYGYVEVATVHDEKCGVTRMRIGYDQQHGALQVGNIIANSSVLLPRDIIENVGFYDPHIALTRVCDWDLWRRVARKYEVKHVDVAMGFEDGPINSDSLGNSYQLDSWVASEWMASFRNELLRPEAIGEYDVFDTPSSLNFGTQEVLEGLAKRHVSVRGWSMPRVRALGVSKHQNGHILVVNLHHDASTSLCFEGLPKEISGRIRIISCNAGFSFEELARATCVIFVRYIEPFGSWIEAAKIMGIPRYFYLDDNLSLMVEEGEVDFDGANSFRPDNLRRNLMGFDGVLLTSIPLLEWFRKKMIHDNCNYISVSWADQMPIGLGKKQSERENGEVTVAVFGGEHRQSGWGVVRPALEKIVRNGIKVHLIGHFFEEGGSGSSTLPAGLKITHLPYESLYCQALVRLENHKPQFLLHLPGATKNHQYKTLHPLLSAALLDAVPVLPAVAPYELVEKAGAAAVIHSPEYSLSWYEGLVALLNDPSAWNDIKRRNRVFCADKFSGKESVALLRGILHRHGGEVGWREQARRLHGVAWLIRSCTGKTGSMPGRENANFPTLVSSAISLAAYRKAVKYSICSRILNAKSDLWDQLDSAFFELRDFSEAMGWRNRKSSLELSDSLHEIPYREYIIRPSEGRLECAQFAVSTDGIQAGLVGVEVISPQGVIKFQRTLDLGSLDLRRPVRFDIDGVSVEHEEDWIFRVFVRSIAPVYIYEFINRRFRGLQFSRETPFMNLRIKSNEDQG